MSYSCATYSWTPPLGIVDIALIPKSTEDRAKLEAALASQDDPSLLVRTDEKSGQIKLRGSSELQLLARIDKLKRAHQIEMSLGIPQVVYREIITRRGEADYTHKKLAQFARLKLAVGPNEAGQNTFDVKAAAQVPEHFLPAIIQGLENACARGPLVGAPVVGVAISLIDGAWHARDSSPAAVEAAAGTALLEALRDAHPTVLQPIMALHLMAPEEVVEKVEADLVARGGEIEGRQPVRDKIEIAAHVPLANVSPTLTYARDLRALTRARVTFTMAFRDYVEVEPTPPTSDPPFRPAVAMRA